MKKNDKKNDNQNDKKMKKKYFNNFQCVAGSVFHNNNSFQGYWKSMNVSHETHFL